MPLADYYQPDHFGLSFELFPPKTEKGEQSLLEHVAQLMNFHPDFFTCTYGAGGSTRDKTLQIVDRVKAAHGLEVAAHLTCVGSTVDELRSFLTAAQEQGVDHIVALRGDPPKGQTEFKQADGGLRYANELVELIRAEFDDFGIAVAGYPETHKDAPSAEVDLQNLRRKVQAGADIIITQLFYDNDDFFRFRDQFDEFGLNVPMVPGLLPVTSLQQIKRIAQMCAAKLPQAFLDRLGKHDDDDWQFKVGVEFCRDQVEDLLKRGVPGIHFYVLNKSDATGQVLDAVQLPARA